MNRSKAIPLGDSDMTEEQLKVASNLRVNGVLANGFRVGMNNWKLFKAHLPFSIHVMALSSVPPRIRELAIIRIAHNTDCDYEFQHHCAVAKTQLGFTDQDIENIKQGPEATGLSKVDANVIQLVDELAQTANISDGLHARLHEDFTEEQFSELLFTVGNYESMTRVINVLQIPMDEDFNRMHNLESSV